MHQVAGQELPQPEEPVADAGTFGYSGGAVVYKTARTRTTATSFTATNLWQNLVYAELSYRVPINGRRLFNVVFSGECSKAGTGEVRIRVIDTVGQSPLEPNDAGRILCSAGNQVSTNTAVWVKNAYQGLHTVRVQILKNGTLNPAVIDDWTFEVVVHNP